MATGLCLASYNQTHNFRPDSKALQLSAGVPVSQLNSKT